MKLSISKGQNLNFMIAGKDTSARCLIFGENMPKSFDQKRWLDNGIFQPDIQTFVSSFSYLINTWVAGPQIYLGKDFAYLQIKIVSIALLRLFRFNLTDDMKNVTYRTMFTLQIDGGLHDSRKLQYVKQNKSITFRCSPLVLLKRITT
ncbi:cytochrome p450 704c1 [Quercus suber]|uniref:Cytochrome p450 704c1 n=1 Tax=Quercus suber TaxID=58331 RepID=A0AAW0IFA9_QUESU